MGFLVILKAKKSEAAIIVRLLLEEQTRESLFYLNLCSSDHLGIMLHTNRE